MTRHNILMSKILIPELLPGSDDLGITSWQQTDSYSCGYAAAFTLLDFLRPGAYDQEDLWKELSPCPEHGVSRQALLLALRRRGLKSRMILPTYEALAAAEAKRLPVLICAKLDHQPRNEAHWMVGAGVTEGYVRLLNYRPWRARTLWEMSKLRERLRDDIFVISTK
jgi:hypothetical protein